MLGLFHGRRIQKLAEGLSCDERDFVTYNSRFVAMNELRGIYPKEIDLVMRKAVYDNRYIRNGDVVDQLLYYDQRTYLPSLLNRLDKMSMAASIEARVPFLDYRLVEWSYTLPSIEKIRGLTNKHIIKRAAEQYLPKELSTDVSLALMFR